MGYLSLQESDPIFTERHYNRKQAAWRMKECTDACLKMVDTTDTINDFVVYLMLNNLILESFCVGDESYQVWRRHGDLVGAVLATGLHQLPDPATTTLTLPSWFRTQLFAACYTLDKSHCVFNGLPPGLSRLYCDVAIPYDLDVNKIVAGPQELALEIDRLDAKGWNTDGKIYPVTSQRALMMLYCIREEILELALRVKVHNLHSRMQELLQRCEETYDSFPAQIKYRPSLETRSNYGFIYYVVVVIRLQHLQNIFLLHRIASLRLCHGSQGLVDNAQEQMEFILSFWLKREHLLSLTMYFDWIATAYGIPCCGVLRLELLKQVKYESDLHVSQSKVIRQLTMFVGFLEWVRPSDGNYILCLRLAKVVQRILDHILDPLPESVPQDVSFDVSGLDVDPMLLPFDGLDRLNWLNTADWTQGAFMESR